MDLIDAIKSRQSIRSFTPLKVPEEKLLGLIDAAQHAPSACNQQLWKFIIVDDEKIKGKLVSEAKSSALFSKAQAIIFVLYKRGIVTDRDADIQSASAAIQNLLLAAHGSGLGATWVKHFGDEGKVKKILNIAEGYTLVSAVILGYPAEKPKKPLRQDPRKLVSFNTFDFPDVPSANYSPRQMSFSQVNSFRDRTIRQTSPNKDSFPYGTKEEFEGEIKIISGMLDSGKSTAELLGFAGTHAAKLLEKKAFRDYSVLEHSKESIYFMEKRLSGLLKSKVKYIFSEEGKFPVKDRTFGQIICMQKLEDFPDLSMLEEAYRLLKEGGTLVLSFRNKKSFFGIHYFMKYVLGKGKKLTALAFEPFSSDSVISKLRKLGFGEFEQAGISPLPFMRGISVKGPLSGFCKIAVIKCKK